jgi:cyclophilin family peptidyl-prolyl cis-trans isomerase
MWLGVAALVCVLVGVQMWVNRTPTKKEKVELQQVKDIEKQAAAEARAKKAKPAAKATMTPGRVVQLDTAKGRIKFVLFEKDCPITTKRIVDMVQNGSYNGMPFPRVEKNGLIQTGEPKKPGTTLPLEVLDGLRNTKGAVGLARRAARNSGTSVFYILMEPQPQLDYDYAVFGRLLTGMDVCFKIERNDVIKRATLRNFTEADRRSLGKVLAIEAERKTQ